MDYRHYSDVERMLLEALDLLKGKLPKEDKMQAREEIAAGEYDLAFEIICQQLFEYDVRISMADYQRLEAIGRRMELSEDAWVMLRSLTP